ncbi:MAG TPA: SH3 domain-containing protein, partial [Anaerolineales bacterium]|nr:SH3 domain-containing protein [Anaerolineales bacterium]
MQARRLLSAAVMMLLAACAPTTGAVMPSPSPAFATATLAGAIQSTPTTTAEAGASTPTLALTTGTATTQVNVRQEPTAAGRILATLKAGETVQIVSRDPGSNWYQIVFDGGDGGRAWIATQYLQVPDQAAVATLVGETLASVREQINVRSGPGTQFDALGLLKADDAVTLTGKDPTGTWLQIVYASGADGKGWVAAAFLATGSTDALPVVAESGEVVGTSTPTPVAALPSPTSALDDGDSVDAPAFSARFNPRSLSSIFYSSDVSWPQGDSAD